LFHEVQAWNRNNIANYREIFIECGLAIRQKRDPKKLYRDQGLGLLTNLTGVDQDYEIPKHPDMKIENNGDDIPETIAEKIYTTFF
jgi:adenylylsulfate kinase-like enzyme